MEENLTRSVPNPTTSSSQKSNCQSQAFHCAFSFTYKPLILIILLALPLRIYWMATRNSVINGDGSEYVRMAENLATGKGLTGNFDGPETMYGPLFSVLTAGLSLLTRSTELAADIILIAFGTALIVPVFLIARRMYGNRVACLSAALVAFHPLFIKLSGSIYNENVYLPLLLGGVYFGMRSLESRRNRDYVLSSLCLSLAYLSRPEAFAYVVFFAFALWISVIFSSVPVRQAALGSLLILGTYLLVASPYMAFLYVHTGHVQLEGKWDINYTIANRIRSGLNHTEAAYGIAADASVVGPLLDPFRFASYTPYPDHLADRVQALLAMAKDNRQEVSRFIYDNSIGGPWVLALVLIGLFRQSWGPRRLFHESIIICMIISVLILMLTASNADFRYILPLAALGTPWIAKGIDELGQWTRDLVYANGRLTATARTSGLIAEVSLVLLIFVVALIGTRSNWLFVCEQAPFADQKQAGLWIKNFSSGPRRLACLGVEGYYAQGKNVQIPYAESLEALRYFDSKSVDFIILESRNSGGFPEVTDWIKQGIPDKRASLIYESDTAGNELEIYRWEKRSPVL